MHKCLLLVLFFAIFDPCSLLAQQRGAAQNGTVTIHEYYVYISGVNTRKDVENLENTIPKKTGVTYFMAYRRPALYYMLKSTIPVSQTQFNSWINTDLYKVEFYGEGIHSKEKAIVVGKKLRKIL